MKLPSLQKISAAALETVIRFPLPLISALAGTTAALILIDFEGIARPTILWNILLAGILGIPLLTGITLLVEKQQWNFVPEWGAKSATLLLLAGFAWTIPQELPDAPAMITVRFLLLLLAAHLFVAVAPYSGRNEINGFWQFNMALCFRILVAALFSGVIFVGLAFGLAALDNLFGMHVPGKRYAELWVLVVGIFTTWFFLAGVPRNLHAPGTSTDYPKGLRVFAQYILLPIVLVYLLILYAYMGKILISWDWPQGWVSKLILGFSGTGIFSLLLLHPMSALTEHTWIRAVTRWFYVVLIPVVVMLFFAVLRRIAEYGITEGRYLALALGVWLAAVILSSFFRSPKKIAFIPASLCAGILLAIYGPWTAFSVAEQSQVSRLETLLRKNAILVDGKAIRVHGDTPSPDKREISAVLAYLQEMHGYESIQPWFGESLREDSTKPGVKYKTAAAVAELIGIEYINTRPENSGIIVLAAEKDKPYAISGYEHLLRSQYVHPGKSRKTILPGTLSYVAGENLDTLKIVLQQNNISFDSVNIDIGTMVRSVLKDHDNQGADNVPPETLSVGAASGTLRAGVHLSSVRLQKDGMSIKLVGYTADILYSYTLPPP